MSERDFQTTFDEALSELRVETRADEQRDLNGFEHGVWSEIALRDEKRVSTGWRNWWALGGRVPLAAAAVAMISVSGGILLGLSQASAYGRETAREFEQRYVESIHPVLMSTSTHPHPHFDGEAPHEHHEHP